MAFTHLHLHTEYSLLDGSGRIEDIISRVKDLGMDSCASTDHGVMYGAIDFYKAAGLRGSSLSWDVKSMLLRSQDSTERHRREKTDITI